MKANLLISLFSMIVCFIEARRSGTYVNYELSDMSEYVMTTNDIVELGFEGMGNAYEVNIELADST